jgi:hypothetical protein
MRLFATEENTVTFELFTGVGYHLVLSKDLSADPNNIMRAVQRHVAEARLESAISAECKILLPHGAASKFADLFETLESQKEALQIFSIGLSETSIEEVFMKMFVGRLVPRSLVILRLFLSESTRTNPIRSLQRVISVSMVLICVMTRLRSSKVNATPRCIFLQVCYKLHYAQRSF